MRDIRIERDGSGRPVRLWFGPEDGMAPESGVTPPVGPQAGHSCEVCGKQITRSSAYWCSRRCKDTAYNRAHPVTRQARLDFTPAASELAQALRGRETKAQRILARLRQGPATTWELARITGRFSARLEEMKKRGLRYERQDFKVSGNEHSVYTMTQEPRGEE